MANLIEYKDVEIHQADQIVLHDVSLHVEAGEMIYLLGKVGSGKSSLMKTVYGALPFASGEARLAARAEPCYNNISRIYPCGVKWSRGLHNRS